MELNRAKILDENFRRKVAAQDFMPAHSPCSPSGAGLDKQSFLALFESQILTRQLDFLARTLREQQKGFYTIASSGHEGNAAIAKAFRPTDIAFLHYRSTAFLIERAKYYPEIPIIEDLVLSLVNAKDDPASGGRHKVLASVPLWVPPQTSTIASHLPKALGTAFSIIQAKTLKFSQAKLPTDTVVLCSFGDASVNHSTAQGAFNAGEWIGNNHIPLPIVWICEDNSLGISVKTPEDWIEKTISTRPNLHYITCDGRNLADVYSSAKRAERIARKKGEPVFLHMKTVRLLGHAGSDVESHYRTLAQIEKDESDDPLLHSARIIIENDWASPQEIIAMMDDAAKVVQQAAQKALTHPSLTSAQEIMAAIIPPKNTQMLPPIPIEATRQNLWGKQARQLSQPRTMAQSINMALTDILLQYPQALVFGEDVGKKGGVYHVTADLQTRFGPARVFDTLLDEQTILGMAIGLAHNGFLPIPEIQFLAYLHNAVDQIRGEAATLSFFSNGQFTNPMVLRLPGLAYQKGFGGHFHNENSIAFLREIPGIVIACPSTAQDAALLLRQCVQQAIIDQRVVIFLEPIALYMNKDIAHPYPAPAQILPFGELGCIGDADLVIISYGNGMQLSRLAAKAVKHSHQIEVKLIDLRWLAPINTTGLLKEIEGKTNIIIVDECRATGSLSEYLTTLIVENNDPHPHIHRITGKDSFIPLGPAGDYVLPQAQEIIDKILSLQ
jgi:2-oxoisovalerate dehydrogenase E1 component